MKKLTFQNYKKGMGIENLTLITKQYSDYFNYLGYVQEPVVKITCGIDPSVRFIGAPISVLKPYFLQNQIPKSGIFMVQNCIRTRNQKNLFEMETLPNWGSFFTGMCSLASYDNLQKLCRETIVLLTEIFKIKKSDIVVNISKRDADLVCAISPYILKTGIIFDDKPETYYRHKYGIKNICGRNFNFAIKNSSTHQYDDIGNIIVIENSKKEKIGVELALGDTTIVKQILGLSHVLDNYELGLDFITDKIIRRRIEDAAIISLVLVDEGLRPNGTYTKSCILKSYLKALALYSHIEKIELNKLFALLKIIETEKLPVKNLAASENVIQYVASFIDEFYKPSKSKEDEKIKKLLSSQ